MPFAAFAVPTAAADGAIKPLAPLPPLTATSAVNAPSAPTTSTTPNTGRRAEPIATATRSTPANTADKIGAADPLSLWIVHGASTGLFFFFDAAETRAYRSNDQHAPQVENIYRVKQRDGREMSVLHSPTSSCHT